MSSAMPISLNQHKYVAWLGEQAQALGDVAPTTLVIRCSEPEPGPPAPWERALPHALQLQAPCADVDEVHLREAIRYAAAELGITEALVVLHSECVYCASQDTPTSDLPFMERVYAGRKRKQAMLETAQQHVKQAVESLQADPTLAHVSIGGLVHIGESGVLQSYDAERDVFEALL